MEFLEHFIPYETKEEYDDYQIGKHIISRDIDFDNIKIALVGVNEDRAACVNRGSAKSPDHIRQYLYRLSIPDNNLKIADLGNLLPGNQLDDTYFVLSRTLEYLIKKNIVPVIIGGSQDLTYANYLAYNKMEQVINIVSVDSKLDLGKDENISNINYLSKIILHQPNNLFNFSNIGYQTYFTDVNELHLMDKLYFDVYRLGLLSDDITKTEPVIRDADLVTFDISAIKQSDAPANLNASPNGFNGQQACQICRYAGLSDKLTSIGFYEINTTVKDNGQTAHLCAQMIWYFIEGYSHRKKDFPVGSRSDFIKYTVTINDLNNEVNFYKSPKSDKWWMEVPFPQHNALKYERHLLVPCSYNDYQQACKDDLPEKWIKTYNKLI